MKKHDIESLERGLRTFQANLEKLLPRDDYEQLIPIWKRPGWTTPAEWLLVNGLLNNMINVSASLVEMKDALIEGSQLVGREG